MLTVGVVSLGCSKNQVDTELMLAILKNSGYALVTDEREADILIVNTCGFIDPAKQESIDTILSLAKYKETGRCRLLVATGCLAQRYEKQLMSDMPEIDLLLGVSQYESLPAALDRALAGERFSLCGRNKTVLCGQRVLTSAGYQAYVRIADGCDNRCAYCAIPLIRGGFVSRDMDGVLREIRQLSAQGVREHILVAQDTSRFGTDTHGRSLLPELMTRAADVEGVSWLRVLYCYPDEVSEELLDAMESRKNICKYIDLPLQHADEKLLKAMNRRGDMARVRRFLESARKRGFTLRTTFIVGFPGETDAQFKTLLDFARDMAFDRMGAFAYSVEEGTPAADMPNQVPEEVKQERLDRLMTQQQAIALKVGQARVGETCEVLIDSIENGVAVGRSQAEAPDTDGVIYFRNSEKASVGEFCRAKLVKAEGYDLWGEIL